MKGRMHLDGAIAPALLLPALLLLLLILIGPFFYMLGIAFTDLSYALPNHSGHFVGFDNFRRLMRDDPLFWESFGRTIVFVSSAVTIEFILGFALAVLLFTQIQRRRFVLTLILIPMMLAPVAVGFIWKLMLQGDFGFLSHYLALLGFTLRPLGDPNFALQIIILIDVWEWTPFITLVMLAGLLSLPRDPYEAAVMDGASQTRIFFDITVPLLRPIIALAFLLRSIDAFKEFDKIFVLTGGGPGTATELLSIYAYRVNFRDWDLGYGAVCAFIIYLVVLVLCSVFYKIVYWKEGRQIT
jgi:multiple sugar transport system permease protein